MLVPILLVGAAAVGAWYLLKDDSKPAASGETPKVPDMTPGDINVDATGSRFGFIPSGIDTANFYMVAWVIYPYESGETATQYYSDFATAKQSYDVLYEFFSMNHKYWTCQGRGIDMMLVEVKNHMPTVVGGASWRDC